MATKPWIPPTPAPTDIYGPTKYVVTPNASLTYSTTAPSITLVTELQLCKSLMDCAFAADNAESARFHSAENAPVGLPHRTVTHLRL